MGQRPLVSVCMPAYNAEPWIGEAIESVLEQTYGDFELVISDNASTDGTMEIACSYHDRRIRIETTPKPIGPASNHNRSVALSTGVFVKFLHADDKLLPTCLEEMVALALEDPGIGLVFAPREVLLEDPESETDLDWGRTYALLHERFTELAAINDGRVLLRQMLDAGIDRNWVGEPSAVLTSRACLTRVGLFSSRLHQIGDLELWLRIMLSHRVGYIPHPLSVYRHHDQSVTAANARVGRDWLDQLWLLEGLLAEPLLEPDARASVMRLRNAAFARATRAQVRRLVRRRLDVGLLSYLVYRARALVGKAPPLYDSLEPEPGLPSALAPVEAPGQSRSSSKANESQQVPPNPLISVCISNHNYARYLPAAIESVLAQSYPNVELVIVDDGSTDHSRQVIESYGDRLGAIFQEQGGQAAAGWAAVQAAKGDVVVFLDADDVLDSEICGHIAAAFGREPQLAVVQWRLRTIDADDRPLARVLPPRPGLLPSGDLSEHILRVRNWQYQLGTGVAYPTWAVRRVLPADLPDGEYHALDFWLNELIPLLGPVRSLDEVGGAHRIHGGNFSALTESSADWPRRLIGLTLNSHEHVRRLAAELGRRCPEDARELRDPAFLGWRLWSLTVDREGHPFPADRRSILSMQGISASLAHPHFAWSYRLKRAAWFALVGSLPRTVARCVIARYPSDGPLSVLR